MRKRKPGTKTSSKHKGNISNRKAGTPVHPSDHMAHNIPDPEGGLMQGKQLGMEPGTAPTPQTMQGPAQYPGQDIGA